MADRYHGTPGPPPNDVDMLVVGSLDRADVYDAADQAQSRLGIQVNTVIRTPELEQLLASKQLQQVIGGQANGVHLLQKASRTLETAGEIADQDAEGTAAGCNLLLLQRVSCVE